MAPSIKYESCHLSGKIGSCLNRAVLQMVNAAFLEGICKFLLLRKKLFSPQEEGAYFARGHTHLKCLKVYGSP